MEKTTYTFSADPSGTHMIVVDRVKPSTKVLDIGCASGYIGEYLVKEKKCEVWGIEPDASSCEQASFKGYRRVINKSVEEGLKDNELIQQKFDYIILADVIEHLFDPERVLASLSTFLTDRGVIIVSTPNIAHYSTRLSLLQGKWDMTDWGILDRTHLHFYTLKTLRSLCTQAGWKVVSVRPRGDLERWFRKIGLEKLGKKILFRWPRLWAVQFIVELVK